MDSSFWAQLLMILLPSLVIVGVVYVLLKKFFDAEERRRFYEMRATTHKVALPIRLQAYERLSLLLERLSVNNLILRVKKPGMDAGDLQAQLLAEIRAEFDHNLSQQIYVSNETWAHIVAAKENLVKTINYCYSSMGGQGSALDLSKIIFEVSMNEETPMTYKALLLLKKEAQELF